jgi:GNAT superfamily N-acetyltransferase
MSMRIKKARLEDAERIHLLRSNTIKKINSKDYSKTIIDVILRKNAIDKIIKRIKEREVFCAWNKEELIGTIELKKNNVGGLYIKTDYIGQGVGKKLMFFIEDYAKGKNVKILKLEPTKTAIGFYEKLGYKMVREFIEKTDKYKVKVYRMEKELI